MLETVFYSLGLFVGGGERIAMAMVVVGHICTPRSCCHMSIWNVVNKYIKFHFHNTYSEGYMSPHCNVLPEAVCCCLQTCNYDQSLVVTDTNTPSSYFLSYGCRTRRRRRRKFCTS